MRDKLNNVNKMFFHNTNKIITFYIIIKIKLHPIPIDWKGVKSNKVKTTLPNLGSGRVSYSKESGW